MTHPPTPLHEHEYQSAHAEDVYRCKECGRTREQNDIRELRIRLDLLTRRVLSPVQREMLERDFREFG